MVFQHFRIHFNDEHTIISLGFQKGSRLNCINTFVVINDYGHVDDETPSFAISLYKEYRRKGIGTRLMEEMLEILRDQGYKRVSLAVQKANYAVKMYQKTGFRIMNENDEEFIMVCEL